MPRSSKRGPADKKAKGKRTRTVTRRELLRAASLAAPFVLLGGAALPPAVAGIAGAAAGTTRVTDALGRTVELPVPDRLERIAFADKSAEMLVLALAPQKVLHLVNRSTLAESARAFLPQVARELPVRTGIRDDEESRSQLAELGAQVVVSMHTYGNAESHRAKADEMQEYLGVTSLCVDGGIEQLPSTARRLGRLLGCEGRAEEVAKYCTEALHRLERTRAQVPAGERRSVLLVLDDSGETAAALHRPYAYALELAGALNALEEPVETENVGFENQDADVQGGGRISVTTAAQEAGGTLDPYLVVAPAGFVAKLDKLRANQDAGLDSELANVYGNMLAVAEGRVHAIPSTPFNWLFDPNGINCLLGAQWACSLLYPEQFDWDMRQVVQEFSSTLYQVDLTDGQLAELGV